MNTKLILTSSAIFLGLIGLLLTFLPHEIGKYMDLGHTGLSIVILQILGALYLGFAMVNWISKGARIGGIYNRPVAIGNFVHFLIGAITWVKYAMTAEDHKGLIWVIGGIYVLYGVLFSIIFRTNPEK